jgi:hypothetical protein
VSDNRGLRAVEAEEFSLADSVGGVRGVVEVVTPGLLFVVVYVATSNLGWSLLAAVVPALVAVVVRLAQRTPVMYAFSGLFGIAVGVFWAWRSGEAQDFYAWGLWTNAIYLVAMLVSIVVRWPLIGLVVGSLRAGFADQARERGQGRREDRGDRFDAAVDTAAADADEPNPFEPLVSWRRDPELVRRYTIATWFWVGLFALRLLVKVPLYFAGDVAWLGTAHLVMGVPLWGLVLWLTWAVVRRPHPDAATRAEEQQA